jgi:hypothetical protein
MQSDYQTFIAYAQNEPLQNLVALKHTEMFKERATYYLDPNNGHYVISFPVAISPYDKHQYADCQWVQLCKIDNVAIVKSYLDSFKAKRQVIKTNSAMYDNAMQFCRKFISFSISTQPRYLSQGIIELKKI